MILKCKLIRSSQNMVFRRISAFFLSVLFCCPFLFFVVSAETQKTVLNQSDFNECIPYSEFRIWTGSGSFNNGTDVDTIFTYNGHFRLTALNTSSFRPGYNGLTLDNYGVGTFKTMWYLPISLKTGETVQCSFDIVFDVSPNTNFLPSGLSCFFSPNENSFTGFSWLSNWEDNGDISNIPRSSVKTQNVPINSNQMWFPPEYRNSSVSVNVETAFSNTFQVRYTSTSDIDGLWMCLVGNPVIRNGGNINQFTDNCEYDIKNFVCFSMDASTGLISGELSGINNSLNELNSSLQGSMNESFDNSKVEEYEEQDAEIESMFNSAVSGSSSYFDIVSGFTATTLRGVRFFGNFITRLIDMNGLKLFGNITATSLTLGFLGTLLGISVSIGVVSSKSKQKKNNKKGGGS